MTEGTLKELLNTVEKRGNKWCVIHCTGPDAGKPIKCFPTKAQAMAMHRAIQARKSDIKHDSETIQKIKSSLLMSGFDKREALTSALLIFTHINSS